MGGVAVEVLETVGHELPESNRRFAGMFKFSAKKSDRLLARRLPKLRWLRQQRAQHFPFHINEYGYMPFIQGFPVALPDFAGKP